MRATFFEHSSSLFPTGLLSLRSTRNTSPHLVQLCLIQVPQLIRRRRLTRDSTLGDFKRTAKQILPADGILCRLAGDLDDADARVVGPAVVRAVAQVAEPGLEVRGVVGLDLLSVGEDAGFAADGGPFAGGVEEANVDFGVGFEIVGLAGFGVGVEEEVDAVAFLVWGKVVLEKSVRWTVSGLFVFTFAANPIHLLARRPSFVTVVIMQNLQRSMKAVRSWTFSGRVGSSMFLPVYGSAVLPPVSVLEKDMLLGEVV